jgi:ABC-type transporter Mla MlaB component
MLAATRLQLHTRNRENCLEIELHGKLDMMTGPRLLALIDAGLANPAFHAFQISAHHLPSVDRDGFAMLVDAGNRVARGGRRFTLKYPPPLLVRFARDSCTTALLTGALGVAEPGARTAEAAGTSAPLAPEGGRG